MTKLTAGQLVKQGEGLQLPEPEFKIGDVVRLVNDGEEDLFIIAGLRLRYFRHMGRYVYYYELAARWYSPMVTARDWFECDKLQAAEGSIKDIAADDVVSPEPMIICQSCNKIRADNDEDCPHCGAES